MRSRRGFTLIELILYIGFVSLMITAFVTFSLDTINSAQKSQINDDLQQNARLAVDRMLQEIRSSSSINTGSSTFGTSPGVLSLATSSGTTNPIIFSLSSGVLQMKQGSGAAAALTDSRYTVSSLIFDNLSTTRTSEVRVTMTIQQVNTNNEAYNASVTAQGTAQVRIKAD